MGIEITDKDHHKVNKKTFEMKLQVIAAVVKE